MELKFAKVIKESLSFVFLCDLLFGFLLVGLERRAAPKAWRSVLGGDGGGGGGGVQFPAITAIPALLNPSTPG